LLSPWKGSLAIPPGRNIGNTCFSIKNKKRESRRENWIFPAFHSAANAEEVIRRSEYPGKAPGKNALQAFTFSKEADS
jgi:hypothetical protein